MSESEWSDDPDLEELQGHYDRYRALERKWVAEYDKAPDGSREKANALRVLEICIRRIRRVEGLIRDKIDEMEDEDDGSDTAQP